RRLPRQDLPRGRRAPHTGFAHRARDRRERDRRHIPDPFPRRSFRGPDLARPCSHVLSPLFPVQFIVFCVCAFSLLLLFSPLFFSHLFSFLYTFFLL